MNMKIAAPSKRPDLQGIRGLAIIGVVFFHFWPKQFPHGRLGVDHFFVLSGYLMCMLLKQKLSELPRSAVRSLFFVAIWPKPVRMVHSTIVLYCIVFSTIEIVIKNK
ncbi:Acyltransferase 3 domain-containing protein [Caenorhabditis elegans]|uniref:Acyltransferase 3 domain-containing protein n=1 Tax=Caenorhabditis elegans TaxID=6239 RepID=Q7YTH8_CAEEL|nr:Acyl_transf_3 domain-containing protein [Caenorhabditis elegans]CAE18033.1 Acyl_transf_3 domain-containing protein [Caenorhabditis elegans]|eukprot:NP_001022946.1 Uncharacterized protein CELE_Y75B8A.37 [Caenorhabditis elegans]